MNTEWQPPSEEEMKVIAARRERSDKISKLMSGYLLKGYKMLGTMCAQCETILLQDRQGTNYCVACSELDSDTEKDNPASSRISSTRAPERPNATAATGHASPVSKSDSKQVGTGSASTAPLTPRFKARSAGGYIAVETIPGLIGGGDEAAQTLSMSSIDVQCWPADLNGHHVDTQSQMANSESTYPGQNLEAIAHLRSPKTEVTQSAKPKTVSSQNSPRFAADKSQSPALLSVVHPAVPASISALWEKVDWASRELKQCQSLECSIQLCTLIKTAAEAVEALKKASV